MNKNWELSLEEFNSLLAWLDPDRERAAIKYEKIRGELIKIFTGRRCIEPEDLADETINRVAHKLKEIKKDFSGDPAPYFYRVARYVLMERLRKKLPRPTPLPLVDPHRIELEHDCLERCIERLCEEDRDLLLRYYRAEGKLEREYRKTLAEELRIAPNALRIRVYRIRVILKQCVEKCTSREGRSS